jgi:flavin reductase (DIM6/NTAB) family NADH-FMN oxidoreductase RutF
MSFKEININELCFNPFAKIGQEWFLVTAGDENGCNTLTASWGFMGHMWNKNVFTTVIRPTRYTYEFIEKSEYFTACFLPKDKKDILKFCGANSGRNCDKIKEAGLTPFYTDGTTAFEEAELIFVCRKIYAADMDISKLKDEFHQYYGAKFGPMHKQFIGEIVKVYIKE